MDIEALIHGYVDSALAGRGIPPGPPDSTATGGALDRLERTIGLRYPPSYRVLLEYRHFHDLPAVGLYFEAHPADGWEARLLALYQDAWDPERIIGAGLIPFGSEAFLDAGPVCFDTRARLPDGECPVVFWDHEWIGTDREIQPMFSSSLKMFEAQRFVAENGMPFLFHEERYPPEVVTERVRRIRRFLEIDPDGAGGPARHYWSYMAGGRDI